MNVKKGLIVAVAVVAAAALAAAALAAGVPLQRLLPLLLVLACPLMMLFMRHGGHGSHAAQGDGWTQARKESPRQP